MAYDDIGDFKVVRGDPWSLNFQREIVTDTSGTVTGYTNLSNYGNAVTAQARPGADSTTVITIACDISNLAGTIDSTATANQLVLSLTASQTAALNAPAYYFDVQFTGGGTTPYSYCHGRLVLVKDITHA